MKTKILFIIFLMKNGAFFYYLDSLHYLHISILDVMRSYTPEFWMKPATFEYYYKKMFKPLDARWREYYTSKFPEL